MFDMIHYLSLQSEDLPTPEQETTSPFDSHYRAITLNGHSVIAAKVYSKVSPQS